MRPHHLLCWLHSHMLELWQTQSQNPNKTLNKFSIRQESGNKKIFIHLKDRLSANNRVHEDGRVEESKRGVTLKC